MTVSKKILYNFNKLSDSEFKTWILNSSIIDEEKQQIESAFEEGMFHHSNGLTPKEYYEENYEENYEEEKALEGLKEVVDKIKQHSDHVKQFQFNQQSNFLYHFVNKFTDTEVPIEAIREELKKLLKQ